MVPGGTGMPLVHSRVARAVIVFRSQGEPELGCDFNRATGLPLQPELLATGGSIGSAFEWTRVPWNH